MQSCVEHRDSTIAARHTAQPWICFRVISNIRANRGHVPIHRLTTAHGSCQVLTRACGPLSPWLLE